MVGGDDEAQEEGEEDGDDFYAAGCRMVSIGSITVRWELLVPIRVSCCHHAAIMDTNYDHCRIVTVVIITRIISIIITSIIGIITIIIITIGSPRSTTSTSTTTRNSAAPPSHHNTFQPPHTHTHTHKPATQRHAHRHHDLLHDDHRGHSEACLTACFPSCML